MAAGDHVRVAVSELRNATVVLKQEATALINDKENTNRQKSNDASHAHLQLKAKQLELGAQNLSDQMKHRIAEEIRGLEQHVASLQQEMDRLTRDATDAANRKQSQAQDLESRIGELERLATQL